MKVHQSMCTGNLQHIRNNGWTKTAIMMYIGSHTHMSVAEKFLSKKPTASNVQKELTC